MDDYGQILFDKQVYEINLMPQRSTFHVYDSEAAYQAGQTQETVMNDEWKGIYSESFDKSLEGFYLKNKSIGDLEDVIVPLPIELQGYGKPQYINSEYAFDGYSDGEYGETITTNNPCMVYVKDFEWEKATDKKYILNFKGSESAMFLYVNGEFVGYSENLFLDSEFDITRQLQRGKNRIAVLCFKYSSSTWLLDQDFFRFSGLFRGVTLSEVSADGIYDIEVRSKVNSEERSSETEIILYCEADGVVRELEIQDDQGITIWTCRTRNTRSNVSLKDLQLWTAETPHLYRLIIRSYKEDSLFEIAELSIGFRDVCIRDGMLLLNGKRLILNGINRHEWNMERGQSVTEEDIEFDVKFLKEHNVNAIRTSHYPNNTSFYQWCDELGLYLMDEACMESHGSFSWAGGYRYSDSFPADDERWTNLCISKLMRMYERDKNHPSILMWSLGNESGTGRVFFQMRERLLKRNPDVLIHYEQGYGNEEYMKVSDVYSSMYTFACRVEEFIRNGHADKPYILCEYMHAMGNSLGDMKQYRLLLDKYPTFQGGFIWDYIDQGLLAEDLNGERKLCYGGDFGDKPNDMDFCGNGIIFADRREAHRSSKAQTMKYYYQPILFQLSEKEVRIQNRYTFRDTSHLLFVLEQLVDGVVIRTEEFQLCLKAGAYMSYPICAASEPGELVYRISAVQKEAQDGIRKGTVLACEECVIRTGDSPVFMAQPEQRPKVIDGHYTIGVHTQDVTYLFRKAGVSYTVAGLYGIQVAGEEFLVREVQPTVFRPNTSNDIGNAFVFQSALALSYAKFVRGVNEKMVYGIVENSFEITYRYTFDHNNMEGATITYRVNAAGEMKVTATVDPLTNLKSLPLFGLHFEIPKNKEQFTYYGKGPFETYPDRKDGILSGIYHGVCEKEYVNYLYPQECGNHEETRYLIVEGENSALRFHGNGTNFRFKYLKHSDFEIENATHVEELPPSSRNHLTICGYMRGVGGDDSWGAPVHEPYVLNSDRPYTFSIVIQPIHKRTEK